MSRRNGGKDEVGKSMPSVEEVQAELAKATSVDDFLGRRASLHGCLRRR
mgnify:CR=1 FL=1